MLRPDGSLVTRLSLLSDGPFGVGAAAAPRLVIACIQLMRHVHRRRATSASNSARRYSLPSHRLLSSPSIIRNFATPAGSLPSQPTSRWSPSINFGQTSITSFVVCFTFFLSVFATHLLAVVEMLDTNETGRGTRMIRHQCRMTTTCCGGSKNRGMDHQRRRDDIAR